MNRLLATTALVLVGFSTTAFAQVAPESTSQSVLERVLAAADTGNLLPTSGVFANIADNIGVLSANTTVYVGSDDELSQAEYDAALDAAAATAAGLAPPLGFTAPSVVPAATSTPAPITPTEPDPFAYAEGEEDPAYLAALDTYNSDLAAYIADLADWNSNEIAVLAYDSYLSELDVYNDAVSAHTTLVADFIESYVADIAEQYTATERQTLLNTIDGSITNTIEDVNAATASTGSVFAMEQVTVDIGDLSTTVLGAVNTGEITLGVNQDLSEAIAGTSSAVSSSITQIGAVADTSALVLNVASNATSVVGSVNSTFAGLKGSIGDVATTVLGAVNTGTITSGINSSVSGVTAGIVGNIASN